MSLRYSKLTNLKSTTSTPIKHWRYINRFWATYRATWCNQNFAELKKTWWTAIKWHLLLLPTVDFWFWHLFHKDFRNLFPPVRNKICCWFIHFSGLLLGSLCVTYDKDVVGWIKYYYFLLTECQNLQHNFNTRLY